HWLIGEPRKRLPLEVPVLLLLLRRHRNAHLALDNRRKLINHLFGAVADHAREVAPAAARDKLLSVDRVLDLLAALVVPLVLELKVPPGPDVKSRVTVRPDGVERRTQALRPVTARGCGQPQPAVRLDALQDVARDAVPLHHAVRLVEDDETPGT